MKKEYVDILSALLTPVIAIITTYIAIQQYRGTRLKLRHDLYDRRLLLYTAVGEFLAHIVSNASVDEAQLVPFLQKTRESYFLFGKNVTDYVTLLYNKGCALHCYDQQLHHSHNLSDEERTRLAHEQGELMKWFAGQFVIAQKKFAKQLSLE